MFDIGVIIKQIKNNLGRKDVLLFLVILGFYLLTRIINLDKFPIFGDEGIYVRWAKVAWHDASWRFISLTDGKQPFQTWGTIPFLKLFPQNPLLAGRLFSASTGMFALIGMMATCFYLFGKRSMYLSGLFYVFTPYFLFYDRMALVDSGVNAFSIWIFLLSIILVKTVRLDIALLYGLLVGMALLAKSSVRLFLGLGYLASILLTPFSKKNINGFLRKFVNFSILYLLSLIIALVIYNVQRLSPFFHYVAEKNKTFVMTSEEFIKTPFANFFNNIKIIPQYVYSEMGYVIGLLGLLGLFFLFKKSRSLALYFIFWLVVPFFIIAFLSKIIFPRYLIFFASSLTMLAVYFLSQIKIKTTYIAVICIILISVIYFDFTIVFDHENIPFPEVDRGQYIEGVTAGWGIDKIVHFAREKSKEKKVILLAEGNFGVVGDQIDSYLWQNDNIELRGYWPLDEKELLENKKSLDRAYVYVVFSHRQEFPNNWPIKLIKKYEKPSGKVAIYFSQLIQ